MSIKNVCIIVEITGSVISTYDGWELLPETKRLVLAEAERYVNQRTNYGEKLAQHLSEKGIDPNIAVEKTHSQEDKT